MTLSANHLLLPIMYLESSDFTSKDRFKHFHDKTCVVMVQANWCPACDDAKPHFQKFAEQVDRSVVCLTVEDTKESKDRVMDVVQRIKPTFEGFPDYLLFKNGDYVPKEITGRTEKHLAAFVE